MQQLCETLDILCFYLQIKSIPEANVININKKRSKYLLEVIVRCYIVSHIAVTQTNTCL